MHLNNYWFLEGNTSPRDGFTTVDVDEDNDNTLVISTVAGGGALVLVVVAAVIIKRQKGRSDNKGLPSNGKYMKYVTVTEKWIKTIP